MYADFEAQDTVVVALSQEDKDLETFARMPESVEPVFDIVADLNREKTLAYDRTTAYLIDKQGIVRQVFPMIIHARPSWSIILQAVKKLTASEG